MSQIRKLKIGKSIPKAQEGYKFKLDSQEITFSDDDLKEIDNEIANLPVDYRRFLGNATNAIKSGGQSGNRAENTVSMAQLSGLNNRDIKRLEAKSPNYFESLFGTDSYVAKEAINEYLQILYRVANKKKSSPSLKKIDSSNLELDFNVDSNGKYSLSKTAKNNYDALRRINLLFDALNSESPEYDISDWDLAWTNGWLDELKKSSKFKTSKEYVEDLWNRMNTSGYDWNANPEDQDFLRNFNIIYKINNKDSDKAGIKDENGAPIKKDGTIDYEATTKNGAHELWNTNGELYTNGKEGDEKPYLLSSISRLNKFGLGQDYLDSVLYKGRIYKPEEISVDTNLTLYNIMQDFITNQNAARSIDDLKKLSNIVNYTDADISNFAFYDPSVHFWPNSEIRTALGKSGKYALYDISNAYGLTDKEKIYELYDLTKRGENNWGFRAPFYLIIDSDGKLSLNSEGIPWYTELPENYKILPNTTYSPKPEFADWALNENGNLYGIAMQVPAAEPSREPYTIYEDFTGNWYYKNSSKGFIRISKNLKNFIMNGGKPTASQMYWGTLSGKKAETSIGNSSISSYDYPGFGRAGSRKNGGNIPIKPLPFKYQKGSTLAVSETLPLSVNITNVHDPLSQSGKISEGLEATDSLADYWRSLPPAEKREIRGAAIDLAGAISNLTGPVGSIASAVSGLGATGFFLSAAKERKGKLDRSDYTQAAISTILDAVSILPWVGEAGKIAKIGKTIQRVAVPIGKLFTLAGLSEAANIILTKDAKDWTTDDLIKLSSGVQAITNIAGGMRVARGESRLAHALGQNTVVETPVYRSKDKYKIGDVEEEITLKDTEVEDVLKSFRPAKKLKEILKQRGVKEEDIIKDPAALLEKFGFESKRRPLSLFVARKALPQEVPDTKFSKYGYLADPLRVFGNPLKGRLFESPELTRRAFIDSQLKNAEIRAQFEPRYTNTISRKVVAQQPNETIMRETIVGKNDPESIAYISSLQRLGLSRRDGLRRTPMTPKETEYVDKHNNAANAEAEFNRAFQEPKKDITTKLTDDALSAINSNPKTAVSNAVNRALGPKPEIREDRALRLGANSISNKELRKYIIGDAVHQGLNETEAVEFLNSLPERKRDSLLKELSKSNSKKVKDILKHFKESPVVKAMRKAYSTPTMTDIIERNNGRRLEKLGKAKLIARNIQKLQNSKDPMKTLSELNATEKNFDQQIFENQEEFQAALNFALSRMAKGRKRANSKDFQDYVDELSGFLDRNNLVIFNKQGGILSAQNGRKVTKVLKQITGPDGQIKWVLDPNSVVEEPLNIKDQSEDVVAEQITEESPKETVNNSQKEASVEKTETPIIIKEVASSDPIEKKKDYEYLPFHNKASVQNYIPETVSQLAKQKAIVIKPNRKPDLGDLIEVLSKLAGYENGGIVKGQSGTKLVNLDTTDLFNNGTYYRIGITNNGQLDSGTSIPSNATYRFWKYIKENNIDGDENAINEAWEKFKKENLIDNTPSTLNVDVNGQPIDENPNRTALMAGKNRTFSYQPDINSEEVKEEENPSGGGYPLNISSKIKRLIPLISGARYLYNRKLQKEYRDLGVKSVDAARFNEQPFRGNLPTFDNTMYERLENRINDDRRVGLKNFGSDLTQYYSALNQKEAKTFDRLQNLYDRVSQAYGDYRREYLGGVNQNLQNEVATANSNLGRSRALDSARFKPEMEYVLRKGQSADNLGLEFETNVKHDVDVLNNYNRIQYTNKVNEQLDKDVDKLFGAEYRAKYNTLPYNERIKYRDYDDYLERTHPDFGKNRTDYERIKANAENSLYNWTVNNTLNYEYSPYLMGRTSKIGVNRVKKGGRLTGKTRYTLEPDERIWIDNNKATHAAIAKLSDNTIKLLLRALK